MRRITLSLVLFALALASALHAQSPGPGVPRLVPASGMLFDQAGKPLNDATTEFNRGIFTIRYAAEETNRIGGEVIPLDLMESSTGRTGIEMEALTAVSVAALTIYDMCKAVDKDMVIDSVFLDEKSGGRSGLYRRTTPPAGIDLEAGKWR